MTFNESGILSVPILDKQEIKELIITGLLPTGESCTFNMTVYLGFNTFTPMFENTSYDWTVIIGNFSTYSYPMPKYSDLDPSDTVTFSLAFANGSAILTNFEYIQQLNIFTYNPAPTEGGTSLKIFLQLTDNGFPTPLSSTAILNIIIQKPKYACYKDPFPKTLACQVPTPQMSLDYMDIPENQTLFTFAVSGTAPYMCLVDLSSKNLNSVPFLALYQASTQTLAWMMHFDQLIDYKFQQITFSPDAAKLLVFAIHSTLPALLFVINTASGTLVGENQVHRNQIPKENENAKQTMVILNTGDVYFSFKPNNVSSRAFISRIIVSNLINNQPLWTRQLTSTDTIVTNIKVQTVQKGNLIFCVTLDGSKYPTLMVISDFPNIKLLKLEYGQQIQQIVYGQPILIVYQSSDLIYSVGAYAVGEQIGDSCHIRLHIAVINTTSSNIKHDYVSYSEGCGKFVILDGYIGSSLQVRLLQNYIEHGTYSKFQIISFQITGTLSNSKTLQYLLSPQSTFLQNQALTSRAKFKGDGSFLWIMNQQGSQLAPFKLPTVYDQANFGMVYSSNMYESCTDLYYSITSNDNLDNYQAPNFIDILAGPDTFWDDLSSTQIIENLTVANVGNIEKVDTKKKLFTRSLNSSCKMPFDLSDNQKNKSLTLKHTNDDVYLWRYESFTWAQNQDNQCLGTEKDLILTYDVTIGDGYPLPSNLFDVNLTSQIISIRNLSLGSSYTLVITASIIDGQYKSVPIDINFVDTGFSLANIAAPYYKTQLKSVWYVIPGMSQVLPLPEIICAVDESCTDEIQFNIDPIPSYLEFNSSRVISFDYTDAELEFDNITVTIKLTDDNQYIQMYRTYSFQIAPGYVLKTVNPVPQTCFRETLPLIYSCQDNDYQINTIDTSTSYIILGGFSSQSCLCDSYGTKTINHPTLVFLDTQFYIEYAYKYLNMNNYMVSEIIIAPSELYAGAYIEMINHLTEGDDANLVIIDLLSFNLSSNLKVQSVAKSKSDQKYLTFDRFNNLYFGFNHVVATNNQVMRMIRILNQGQRVPDMVFTMNSANDRYLASSASMDATSFYMSISSIQVIYLQRAHITTSNAGNYIITLEKSNSKLQSSHSISKESNEVYYSYLSNDLSSSVSIRDQYQIVILKVVEISSIDLYEYRICLQTFSSPQLLESVIHNGIYHVLIYDQSQQQVYYSCVVLYQPQNAVFTAIKPSLQTINLRRGSIDPISYQYYTISNAKNFGVIHENYTRSYSNQVAIVQIMNSQVLHASAFNQDIEKTNPDENVILFQGVRSSLPHQEGVNASFSQYYSSSIAIGTMPDGNLVQLLSKSIAAQLDQKRCSAYCQRSEFDYDINTAEIQKTSITFDYTSKDKIVKLIPFKLSSPTFACEIDPIFTYTAISIPTELIYNSTTHSLNFSNYNQSSTFMLSIQGSLPMGLGSQVTQMKGIVFGNYGGPILQKTLKTDFTCQSTVPSKFELYIPENMVSDPDLDDQGRIFISFQTDYPELMWYDFGNRTVYIKCFSVPGLYQGTIILNDNNTYFHMETSYNVTLTVVGQRYIPPLFKDLYNQIMQGIAEPIFKTTKIKTQSNTLDNTQSLSSMNDTFFQAILEQIKHSQDSQQQIPYFNEILQYLQILLSNDSLANSSTTSLYDMLSYFNSTTGAFMNFQIPNFLNQNKLIELLTRGKQLAANLTIDMRALSISQRGVLKIGFSTKSQFITSRISVRQLSLLMIRQDGEVEVIEKIIIERGEDYIKVQLKFKDPYSISLDQQSDILRVMNLQQMTVIQSDVMWMLEKNQITEIFIPTQISEDQEKYAAQIEQAISIATLLFIPGNAVLNILISGAMAQLWGMMNSLANLTILSLISVNIPGIARLVSKALISFAQFDVFPSRKIIDALGIQYSADSEDELTPQLQDIGFGAMSVTINMGSALIFLWLNLTVLGFSLVMSLLSHKIARLSKLSHLVNNKVLWSFPLRFIMQQYLTLYVSSIINMYQLEFGSPYSGNNLDVILAISLMVVCSLYPLWMIAFCIINFKRMDSQEWKTNYGTLTDDLSTQYKMKALCNGLEMLKFQVTLLILMFLGEYPAFQILLQYFISVLFQAYLIYFKPYQSLMRNAMAVFNEFLITAYLMPLVPLTDYQDKYELKLKSSWALIFVLGLSFSVNLIVILVTILKIAVFKVQNKLTERKLRNMRKKKYEVEQLIAVKPNNYLKIESYTIDDNSRSEIKLDPSNDNTKDQEGHEETIKETKPQKTPAYRHLRKMNKRVGRDQLQGLY